VDLLTRISNYGNSLAYASSDMGHAASSSQVLADVTIPSGKEFSIWSDIACDEDCGFSRDGAVALRRHASISVNSRELTNSVDGFNGAAKAFLFEFSMPDDGTNSDDSYSQANMPAIWMLNAKVSRTAQYPKDPSCSCWKSGCGEFDIFEVLDPGDTKCKSTIHFNQGGGGGASDYFPRPTTSTIKAAVVFNGDKAVHIQILDDSINFNPTMTDTQLIRGLTDDNVSVFSVGS
jgi:Putative TOS1-like glycosyl hydrolase (DUF2401)